MDSYTKATLSNGIRVANFSTAFPYLFTDGTILKECSRERSKLFEPHFSLRPGNPEDEVVFVLSAKIIRELEKAEQDDEIDILIVPFAVMAAIKNAGWPSGKAREALCSDPVAHTIHIDTFCA